MNIIKYKPFHDTKSLKESILLVMNKLLNLEYSYQQVVFSLLMMEISREFELILLNTDYNAKAGYWCKKYGPCKEFDLAPNKLNSYYITIFKYFDEKNYRLIVISCRDLIKKETGLEIIDWIKEYNKHQAVDIEMKKNCIIS